MGQEAKRIASTSFFAKGKKIGVAKGGSLTKNSNSQSEITDDGWSETDGTQTSDLKLDTIDSIDGDTEVLDDALDSNEYITIQVTPVGGKTRTGKARVITAQYDWSADKRSANGSFTFRAGRLKKS